MSQHRQQFQNRVEELKKRLQERATQQEDSPVHIIMPKYPTQQQSELMKVESCSRPSAIEELSQS